MKKVIIDSNVLFRALRGKHSRIRDYLHDSENIIFAPNFLLLEIFKHKNKLFNASKCSEDELLELLEKIMHRIHFINEDFISTANFIHAFRLCSDIDEKDTVFVALTLELEGLLWTYDDELKYGLKSKGFNQFFDFIGND